MLTVAICTWNRAATLDRTLGHFQRVATSTSVPWELLVVNNNCTDDTRRVVDKHAGSLPLRPLFEEQAGLSHARNRAVDATKGDLLIWADDDIRVCPQWLEQYAAASANHADAAFFGGPIEPTFDEEPPPWLQRAMRCAEPVFGKIDLGPEEHLLSADALPSGANFAVRTEVQRKHRFDPVLGRCGPELLAGEETALMRTLLQEGHRGLWLPAARVEHCIPAELMTLDYLCKRFTASGKTAAMMKIDRRRSPWYLRGKTAVYESFCRIYQHLDCPEKWVRYRLRASYMRGQLAAG